jgi:FAD/FMN-containing dehydrogenase
MELMDHNTLRLVQAHGSGGNDGGGSRLLRDMLQADITEQKSDRHSHLYLLVETQGSNSEDDASKMNNFLSRLYDEGSIRNGYLAQDTRQISEMWSIRESCNPCVSRAGCVYKFDVSVPIEDYVTIARGVEGRLSASMEHEDIIVCLWGHVNDGNAHINIVTPGRFEKEADIEGTIEKIVFDEVLKHGGSISAEHGIGQKKNEVLGRLKGEHVMNIMAQIKALFDPHGIMNPGKYLPKK